MGKAGAGKDYIARQLTDLYPEEFRLIVSCTTRPMRDYEINGYDYHFLTENNFKATEMLETTSFNGWYYGTPLWELSENKINVGIFNPQGVIALQRSEQISLFTFYIEAQDKTRLIRQLTREENPNIAEILRRYSTDQDDFSDYLKYIRYTSLVNEHLEDPPAIIERLKEFNYS